VGGFDGERFKPETPKLPGHRGRGFYAAQTFSDVPQKDGRRIQIGWGQMPAPGMPFDQMMCFPCELSLRSTADGPRLAWKPVREVETLRVRSHLFKQGEVKPGDEALAGVKAELLELRAEIEPGDAKEYGFVVRGLAVRFDTRKKELHVGAHRVSVKEGKQRLTVLVDRTSVEVFADDGLTYVPMPFVAKAGEQGVSLFVKGGAAKVTALEIHELGSAWSPRAGE
jgi:sucrose-6-phosphate hydrolase SacC (GH32 family)